MFLVEGAKMVYEALNASDFEVYWLVGTEDFLSTLPEHLIKGKRFGITEASTEELSRVGNVEHNDSGIAVIKVPKGKFELSTEELLRRKTDEDGLFLALDRIKDPGNMGTILRLADWFGVSGVLISEGCVELFNPKVVQATMGSIFRVSVAKADLGSLKGLAPTLPLMGAIMQGPSVYQTNFPKKGILLMGNESEGLANDLVNSLDLPLHIPKFGQAESLNVAMATGIILSHWRAGLSV